MVTEHTAQIPINNLNRILKLQNYLKSKYGWKHSWIQNYDFDNYHVGGVLRSIKVVSVFRFGDRKCRFRDMAICVILRKVMVGGSAEKLMRCCCSWFPMFPFCTRPVIHLIYLVMWPLVIRVFLRLPILWEGSTFWLMVKLSVINLKSGLFILQQKHGQDS